MDDLEFRKKATIDPNNQQPDFLEKKNQNEQNRRLVENLQGLESQIEKALNIASPENLNERIILAQQLAIHKQQQKRRSWLKLTSFAASVMLIVSVTVWLYPNHSAEQLQQQIMAHIHEDVQALNVKMSVPKTRIDSLLASYGGHLEGPIGKVTYIGHCIIGKQTGIHLVVDLASKPVTVLILPTQPVAQQYSLDNTQYSGIVYPSHHGSIAIVSEFKEHIEPIKQRLDNNLNWII